MKRLFLFAILYFCITPIQAKAAQVVINEIAWMGTMADSNDEWIELYNISGRDIDLNGWKLEAKDGSPSIPLSGTIEKGGYFLLERTADDTISDITADTIYSGSLSNTGEYLILTDAGGNIHDEVSQWFAGNNDEKKTMERKDATIHGNDASNWGNNNGILTNGKDANGNSMLGTPKSKNSIAVSENIDTTPPSRILDLRVASDENISSFTLAWTSPGDDENTGQAFSYDIRMSMESITEDNFMDAFPLSFPYFPKLAGAPEQMTVHDLEEETLYYFAVKTSDEAGNISPLSNVLETTTGKNQTEIFINEFVFQGENNNDWVEIACTNCPPEGLNLSNYTLNDIPLCEGCTITNDTFFKISAALPDENGFLNLKNAEGEVIDNLTYGSGSMLDYQSLFNTIQASRCEENKNDMFSIGKKVSGSGSEIRNLNDSFQLFTIPTPEAPNHIINGLPKISFQINDIQLMEENGNPVYILKASVDQSCDPDADSMIFTWNFGDTSTAEGRETEHKYQNKGAFQLTLEAKDEAGGISISEQNISLPAPDDIKIVINEFNYDDDWIELFCIDCGEQGIFLHNIKLLKNTSTTTYVSFPENIKIENGDYVAIYLREDEERVSDFLPLESGGRLLTIHSKKTGLASDGSLHVQFTNMIKKIDSVTWSKKPSSDYQSFMRNDTAEYVWTTHETPGAKNIFSLPQTSISISPTYSIPIFPPTTPPVSQITYSDAIRINELFMNPKGADENAEFIELKNTGLENIDLSAWKLDDETGGGSSPFTIPNGTLLGPQEYIFFLQKTSKIPLNNTSDTIRLLAPDGMEKDSVSYNNAKEGYSFGKNNENSFVWTTIATPGKENLFDAVQDEGIVVNIIDGDTIDVLLKNGTKERVRLIGVDTPETSHPQKNVEFFGLEAKNYTSENLLNMNVILEYEERKTDAYDRYLAYIFLKDGTLFNGEIIRNGFGYVYTRFPFHYQDLFLEYQNEARSAKRGLWADPEVGDLILELSDTEPIEDTKETENTEPVVTSKENNSCTGVILSEILASPQTGEEEFIEIQNQGESEADLSGCMLDDIRDGGSKPYVIENVVLQPQEFFVFTSGETKISLNNSGDEVYLLDSDNTIQDSLTYGKHTKGMSFSRHGDTNEWEWTETKTPGEANVFTSAQKNTTEEKEDVLKQIEKQTKMHQYILYKKKGLVLKGRTLPETVVTLRVDGGNEITLVSDGKGYFMTAYLHPLAKGDHTVGIEIPIKTGVSWRNDAIQKISLTKDYTPPTVTNTVQKKKSTQTKSTTKKYTYVPLLSESDTVSGKIIEILAEKSLFILENEKKEVLLASFENFKIPEWMVSEYFRINDTVLLKGKFDDTVFVIEQFEKKENFDEPQKSLSPEESSGWDYWKEAGLLGVLLLLIAGGGVWLRREKIITM